MELKIIKGTTMLEEGGFYRSGTVYMPATVLESFVGLWQGTVFIDSPLAGKRICVPVLSTQTYANKLPPALENFLDLCSASGAQIILHDGGSIPPADLVLAVEPNTAHPYVHYLGTALRSKPLAKRITSKIKRGLNLAYLPDPVGFNKPQYNLKLRFWARFFTPAVAVQWPEAEDLGPWLFTSLMEHFGRGTMDGQLLKQQLLEQQPSSPALPHPQTHQQASPVPLELNPTPEPEPQPQSKPPPPQPQPRPSPAPGTKRQSASMSQAQYPGFFSQKQKQRPVKKAPFT